MGDFVSCGDCPQSWNQLKQGCAQNYVWKKFCLKILNLEKNLFLKTKMKKRKSTIWKNMERKRSKSFCKKELSYDKKIRRLKIR